MPHWDTGLFDCFSDVKVCLVTCYCASCQVAVQHATAEDRACGCGDFLLTLCFPLCCAVITRAQIREKYGFDGSCVGDTCAIVYCGLCAISQHTRQLHMRGAKPAGLFMEH